MQVNHECSNKNYEIPMDPWGPHAATLRVSRKYLQRCIQAVPHVFLVVAYVKYQLTEQKANRIFPVKIPYRTHSSLKELENINSKVGIGIQLLYYKVVITIYNHYYLI